MQDVRLCQCSWENIALAEYTFGRYDFCHPRAIQCTADVTKCQCKGIADCPTRLNRGVASTAFVLGWAGRKPEVLFLAAKFNNAVVQGGLW